MGSWIAKSGHTLVFGGATGGLMTSVSEAAAKNGGKVIGVIPRRIIAAGRESKICSEIHIVRNMNERKERMKQLADVFVCLPGSYGTMDEMFDVIASGTVGEHTKPLYILNYEGFYNPLLAQIQLMKDNAFIPQRETYTPQVIERFEDLKDLKDLKI